MDVKYSELEHFEKIADVYDQDFSDYGSQQYIKITSDYLSHNASEGLILELGAGTGNFSGSIIKQNNFLVSSDISRKMISHAKNKNKYLKIEFAECDAENLPFKNEMFDQVCCVGLLHHMVFLPNSYFCAIDEMIRVLKRGGSLIIIEPNYGNIFQKISYNLSIDRKTTSHNEKPIALSEIKYQLIKRNLTIMVIESFIFLPRLTPKIIFNLSLPIQRGILKIFKNQGRDFFIKCKRGVI